MAEDIEEFLKSVNPTFGKYAEKLTEQGLTTTEELSYMQDDDFKHIGVPLFHWRKIVASAKSTFGSAEDNNTNSNMSPSQPSQTAKGSISAVSMNHYEENELNDWGTDEVALFIRCIANGEHAPFSNAFLEKGVDGTKLLQLSSVKQLAQIVPDLGARYAIWEAVQECKV